MKATVVTFFLTSGALQRGGCEGAFHRDARRRALAFPGGGNRVCSVTTGRSFRGGLEPQSHSIRAELMRPTCFFLSETPQCQADFSLKRGSRNREPGASPDDSNFPSHNHQRLGGSCRSTTHVRHPRMQTKCHWSRQGAWDGRLFPRDAARRRSLPPTTSPALQPVRSCNEQSQQQLASVKR